MRGVSRVRLGGGDEGSGPGHILYGVTTDEVTPSSTRDSASRFQLRGSAAGCWKSSFPRRGSSDCGSSALGDRQLMNTSEKVALDRKPDLKMCAGW